MAKQKKKKEKDPAAPKQEIDAVKGFVFVMILLIVALGVFIFITNGKLSEYEGDLDRVKAQTRGLGLKSLEVGQYLKLIDENEETVLLNYPSRFFMNRYRVSEVNVREEQVAINRRRETPNRREQYTEISWPIEMKGINRRQASLFLWGVEEKSAKARTIELRMTRDQKAGEDMWNGTFKIGYRIAGAGGGRQ